MLSINMDDVIKVLNSIKSQLIGFGVVAVLLIAVMIACRKQSKSKKYLIRWQAGLGMVLALAITVNLILTGPMYSMVTLATGGGKVSEENVASATQLCEDIADEGIVLLDNDGTLPMAKNSKLNVFGWASTNPCYGGTGSGALSDAYPTVTLLEGLKNAGFELNTELSDFYTAYRADRPVVGMFSQDWTLPEPEAAQYTDELMNNAKAFSDTAMVVITRVGGEGADLPTDVSQVTYDAGHSYNDFEPGEHYLQLSKTEKDMIDLVCKNFDKVVVVYNGANAMELGWVKDYSQIKSVVWCAGTGQSGFNALGSILCGDVNPSGRTIDTFVYDLTQTPTANNFGNFNYTNMDEFKANAFGADTIPAFVNYVEGIYVGYKFYETAAAEGLIDYDKTVVYPFGRGLSYTTFTQTLNSVTEADGTITVDVTVTNTGSASGKEVVEVYYNPPYTNGGIEKASANLIGFAKTSELAPGASENVTVTFKAEDMASYDTYGKGCYVLEKGDYVISINADSHTVLDSKVYNVASDIVYDASNKRESDVEVADNKFDFAEGNVTYLSRADGFANYAEATAAPADFELPAEAKATFYNNSNWNPEDFNNADDVAPTTGAKNGLKLKDMVGVDYNDAQWDAFL
ncbi:MAG: glycoside hydrolase family 3 C-terminal domain-containing protein, partial [Faecalibacterium sp.]|nr:glycoside hydrolase family 3 C-terminal domain-containing protein [Faecalibacterium sp.]